MQKCKAILFDLDGTLLDTAPDLANALNHVLISENKSPLSFEKIRPVASDGARGLLHLGFDIDETHPRFELLRERFLSYYSQHLADETRLFAGMETILQQLETKNIPWGIVTNKPISLTQKILDKLELTKRAACVIGGDSLPQRKPHPAPLLHAATQINLSSENCFYIGDAERDIQAARAAGMFSIAALYGYLHKNAQPKLWQADKYAETLSELHQLLMGYV